MLKRISCPDPRKACGECLLNSKCVYARIFEPQFPSPLRRYTFVPRPYVLSTSPDCHHGKSLTFDLTLIGHAAEDLPYFIYACYLLGKEGIGRNKSKLDLQWVKLVRPSGEEQTIYTSQTETLEANCPPVTWTECVKGINGSRVVSRITLLFHSPLRIKERGDLVVDLSFPVFASRLKERIDLLSHLYCGGPVPREDKEINSLAREITVEKHSLRWQEMERYSTRQKAKMKLGGLIGMITFRGNLNPFIPYLILGQYIHVGQGTTFGLGKYEILKW